MTKEDKIIYDLLYSNEIYHVFDITDMVNESNYQSYIQSIVDKINLGKVYVIKDSLMVTERITWEVLICRM